MTAKQVLFRSAAREKVLRGAAQLADAVRITLGPKSKSVLIQKKWGAPIVCNDGVTIAKEMELEDPEENLGAQMLRQAAEKTGDAVGDGTSTATILAHAIFADGVRNVAAGASAIDIKRGLDRGLEAAVKALKALAKPVGSRKEKAQVATISAHNDPTIGELVADAMEKVGGDGVITVEESKTTETTLEVVEGLQFDRGYLSPYFVTDTGTMEAVLEDALRPDLRPQAQHPQGHHPAARAGGEVRPADPLHRRGHRGRGARHADRQSDPRRAEERGREGARLRRPAQGDAAGHRDADRRAADLRGAGNQARRRAARAARPCPARGRRQGQHHDHRRRGQQGAISRAASR